LLKIHKRLSQALPLELAIKQGERLLDASAGAGGFAQGPHGIAWALSELYNVTAQNRFRQAADHFALHPPVESAASPYDQRKQTSWADGAAGIGMAMLRRYELFGDQELMDQAKAAVEKVISSLSMLPSDVRQVDYCPAYGVMGEAELLLDASRILDDKSYTQLAERVGHIGIECFRKDDLPWPCAGTDYAELPGLMNGLAGIGHSYLRLYDSKLTSSLLMPRPA
jgi:lantibiotic biosynthesis protein